jgi:hypothetical protein
MRDNKLKKSKNLQRARIKKQRRHINYYKYQLNFKNCTPAAPSTSRARKSRPKEICGKIHLFKQGQRRYTEILKRDRERTHDEKQKT